MGDTSQSLWRRAGGGGSNDWTRLFGQMMLMPFSTFSYSINMLLQMMQGMQAAPGDGSDAARGGVAQPCGGGGGCYADNEGAQTFGGGARVGPAFRQRTTRTEDRSMSDQSWSNRGQGGGDWGGGGGGQQGGGGGQSYGGGGGGQNYGGQGWSVGNDCRNLEPCDQLRLVRYKILFLKRDLEIAFPEEEELVAEEMNEQGFVAWKIAEFIQKMARREVRQPGKWVEKNYPHTPKPPNPPYVVTGQDGKTYVTGLPDPDKRFLRVYVQVLASYDRERTYYERDKLKVLEEIRDKLG
jgi:hypothetical protein